jgi:hypothetical protein
MTVKRKHGPSGLWGIISLTHLGPRRDEARTAAMSSERRLKPPLLRLPSVSSPFRLRDRASAAPSQLGGRPDGGRRQDAATQRLPPCRRRSAYAERVGRSAAGERKGVGESIVDLRRTPPRAVIERDIHPPPPGEALRSKMGRFSRAMRKRKHMRERGPEPKGGGGSYFAPMPFALLALHARKLGPWTDILRQCTPRGPRSTGCMTSYGSWSCCFAPYTLPAPTRPARSRCLGLTSHTRIAEGRVR